MRDALISIKSSDMRQVLDSYGLEFTDTEYLTFMKKMRARRCVNRTAVFTNTVTARKVSKNIRAVSNNVEKFNGILRGIRMDQGHKGVGNITKDHKQYEVLKTAASIYDEFAKDFDITDTDKGIDLFIRIGLDIMGKRFGLNKFNYYRDQIYQEFESRLLIREDENPEGSKLMYQMYGEGILHQSGVEYHMSKDSDLVHFIYARMEADEVSANYELWLEAQFEGLSFLNVVPEPGQLYGLKALERYNRYSRKSAGIKKQNPAPTKTMSTETKDYIMEARKKRLSE